MKDELFDKIRKRYRSLALEINPTQYTIIVGIGGFRFEIWLYQSSVGYWEGANWIEEFCVNVSDYTLGEIQSPYYKSDLGRDVVADKLIKNIKRSIDYLYASQDV